MISYPAVLSVRRDYPPCIFTVRDTLLYALSLGLGSDPMDSTELRFVFERELTALPTVACVIGAHSIKDLDLGIDYSKVVHGEQSLRLFNLIPNDGTFSSCVEVASVVDHGPGKGAIINLRRSLRDEGRNELLAETVMSLFCRGAGGFGGPAPSSGAANFTPARDPDAVFEQQTLPQAALLYRLNGDMNPLHADPQAAARAGFDRPILHGLATFGMAARAILARLCDGQPGRIQTLRVRFRAPVYPGDILRTEMWRSNLEVDFRTIAVNRHSVVLEGGRADIRY